MRISAHSRRWVFFIRSHPTDCTEYGNGGHPRVWASTRAIGIKFPLDTSSARTAEQRLLRKRTTRGLSSTTPKSTPSPSWTCSPPSQRPSLIFPGLLIGIFLLSCMFTLPIFFNHILGTSSHNLNLRILTLFFSFILKYARFFVGTGRTLLSTAIAQPRGHQAQPPPVMLGNLCVSFWPSWFSSGFDARRRCSSCRTRVNPSAQESYRSNPPPFKKTV